MPPTAYDRTNIDGALRAFRYIIPDADQEIDARSVEQTQAGDWDRETVGDPFAPNTVFYRHVSSTTDVEER